MNLFILIAILVCFTFISTAYLHEQGPQLSIRTNNEICVYDFIHQYLLDLSEYYHMYNVLLFVFVTPLIWNIGSYNPAKFFYDLLWLLVPIFIFRCVTICLSIPTRTTNVDRDWGHWLKQYIFGNDFDLNSSGHISVAFGLVLLMLQYRIIENKALWFGLVGAYGLFSSASKNHYSIDVAMAFPVVIAFYDFSFCKSAVKDITVGGCAKGYFDD